jgi:hypothetical protein
LDDIKANTAQHVDVIGTSGQVLWSGFCKPIEAADKAIAAGVDFREICVARTA